MDLLTGNVRRLYFKFLSAAFGSALISSIYGMVDMAMVGQYQGPDGAAALGGCRAGVEHHLFSWPSDRHRRKRSVQRAPRRRAV